VVVPSAQQHAVEDLPEETLGFLRGSRYCETDLLSQMAWDLFEKAPPGWARVQAICDYVHNHITFGYEYARVTKTAFDAFNERTGVCRDYTHLAVALCRCMNIPARYCTGYLGDIGIPPPYSAMDFAAWMEVYLGGRWYTFDPEQRSGIGRVLVPGVAIGRCRHHHNLRPNTLRASRSAEEVGGLESAQSQSRMDFICPSPSVTSQYKFFQASQMGEHRMMFRPEKVTTSDSSKRG
jgi:hypothetical protein